MWKEFLSSIGFGKAKVETLVHNPVIRQNEILNGEVIINGGICDQKIKKIILSLLVRYDEERDDSDFFYHEKEVYEEVIDEIGRISADKERRILFRIPIKAEHPVSNHSVKTILRTTLKIAQGVNAKDEDTIEVIKKE